MDQVSNSKLADPASSPRARITGVVRGEKNDAGRRDNWLKYNTVVMRLSWTRIRRAPRLNHRPGFQLPLLFGADAGQGLCRLRSAGRSRPDGNVHRHADEQRQQVWQDPVLDGRGTCDRRCLLPSGAGCWDLRGTALGVLGVLHWERVTTGSYQRPLALQIGLPRCSDSGAACRSNVQTS